MLDCGGMVDLGEFLSLAPETGVYVFDSHRPYSLINIFGNSQVWPLRKPSIFITF